MWRGFNFGLYMRALRSTPLALIGEGDNIAEQCSTAIALFFNKPVKMTSFFVQGRHPIKLSKLIFLTIFLELITAYAIFSLGGKGVMKVRHIFVKKVVLSCGQGPSPC